MSSSHMEAIIRNEVLRDSPLIGVTLNSPPKADVMFSYSWYFSGLECVIPDGGLFMVIRMLAKAASSALLTKAACNVKV